MANPEDDDQKKTPVALLRVKIDLPDTVDSSKRESEIYGARIDGLSGDVDDLKERIFRSKARLTCLGR